LQLVRPFLVFALACACSPPVEGEGESSEGEGEGEGEPEEPCVIGDPTAPAEIELVARGVDGLVVPFTDGDEVDLILPVQGGKVFYLGVQGRNLTCHVQLTGALTDTCQDPPRFGALDGRTVILEDDGSGKAVPVNDPQAEVVANMSNIAACPLAVATHDIDRGEWGFQIRVTEGFREGEDERRVHNLTGTVRPRCAQPDHFEDCSCECDADFNSTQPKDEQCPTIHDNDGGDGCVE
jgi:hypothetical protein